MFYLLSPDSPACILFPMIQNCTLLAAPSLQTLVANKVSVSLKAAVAAAAALQPIPVSAQVQVRSEWGGGGPTGISTAHSHQCGPAEPNPFDHDTPRPNRCRNFQSLQCVCTLRYCKLPPGLTRSSPASLFLPPLLLPLLHPPRVYYATVPAYAFTS